MKSLPMCTVVALMMALMCGLGGCRGEPAEPDAGRGALTPVTLLLNWYPEAEHGGYYAALVHGYYEQAGLDVTILPGGPGVPVLQKVARGDVTFGVTNADQVILGRAQEADNVAVLAPLQQSPRCLIVPADSGITRFDQLRDLTIAMSSSAAWAEYLKSQLDFENVEFVPPGNAALVRFLQEPRFAVQGYVFSEPFVVESQGGDPHCLMVSDLGFNPYTSLLICNEQTLDARPEVVRRMVSASLRGWQHYVRDPEETNARIHERNPQMSLESLAYGARALVPLCRDVASSGTGEVEQAVTSGADRDAAADESPKAGGPGGALAVTGAMRESRWAELIRQMESVGSIPAGRVGPRTCFRLDFLSAPGRP